MKKIISFLIVCFFVTVSIQAQDLGKVYFGIKGGYNFVIANFTAAKTTPQHGGYAGIMLKIPFENRLHFVPQFDLSYRGMKAKSLPENTYSKITELHARIMPLLQIDFKNPALKENTGFVQFGPSIGFGITGNQTKQDQSGNPTSRTLKYGFQHYGQFDASWHTGLGYETTGGLRLLVDFSYGLSNMINTDDAPLLKFHTISAGIAYWFGKK